MQIPATAEDRRALVHNDILPNLDVRPFIDGKFIDSSSDSVINTSDPMTLDGLAAVPSADIHDVNAAISAARKAFDDGRWSEMHPRNRALYLYKLADLIERDKVTLALLEAADAGKRFRGVLGWDIPNAGEVYRYYAGWCDKITGSYLPAGTGTDMFTRREPVGVCAAIIPWNFPFPCMSWKVGPALAAGCTVIIKSPERAPLSAQYLAKLAAEAGFPAGVINVISGIGEVTGRALVSDPRIDKITFTGEAATARDILGNSLNHMPRVTFELGDKTPNIIFADADLESASAAAVGATFGVSGQNCCAGSRTLVEASALDEVQERMTRAAQARRLGDQFDDSTEQGPQIDTDHVSRIDQYVHKAVADGAEILVGGNTTLNARFYSPTLIVGASSDGWINQNEVFGPVGTLIPFSSIDEAIAIANNRDFGLAAAVWTTNQKAADVVSRQVRCGTVWINTYEHFDSMAPWGGRRLSGIGRELGADGIDGFLETKTIVRVY